MPFAIIHNSFRWRVNTQGTRRQRLEFVDLAEIYLLGSGLPRQNNNFRTKQRHSRRDPLTTGLSTTESRCTTATASNW